VSTRVSRVYNTTARYGERHHSVTKIFQPDSIDKLVDVNWVLKAVVETTIVLNCLQLGFCTNADTIPKGGPDFNGFCTATDIGFTVIFVGEFVYKIWVLRCMYFSARLNWMDFVLLFITITDAIFLMVEASVGGELRTFLGLKMLRLLRIFRILRVLQHKKEMRLVLEGLLASFHSMIWVVLVMVLLIYMTSILCVTFFRDAKIEIDLNFQNLPKAMFTLFTLAILGDWTDIVTPVLKDHWWAGPFFVGFIICATFGVMNLIIGVITERTAQVQQEHRDFESLCRDNERMENIKEIAEILFNAYHSEGDDPNEHTISKEVMETFVKGEKGTHIEELVSHVRLPAGFEVTDCHAMFDRDASGTITQKEFEDGMGRLIFSNEFQRSCMVQSSIADVMVEMKRVETVVLERMNRLEQNVLGCGGRTKVQRPHQTRGPTRQPSPLVSRSTATNQSEPSVSSAGCCPCLPTCCAGATQGKTPSEAVTATAPPRTYSEDLPACKAACRQLLERLQEPLELLLADDLDTGRITSTWPPRGGGQSVPDEARDQGDSLPSTRWKPGASQRPVAEGDEASQQLSRLAQSSDVSDTSEGLLRDPRSPRSTEGLSTEGVRTEVCEV